MISSILVVWELFDFLAIFFIFTMLRSVQRMIDQAYLLLTRFISVSRRPVEAMDNR